MRGCARCSSRSQQLYWQPTAYCNYIGGGAGCEGGARALARRFAHARSRQPFLPYIPLDPLTHARGPGGFHINQLRALKRCTFWPTESLYFPVKNT